jgi:hypothetical protein
MLVKGGQLLMLVHQWNHRPLLVLKCGVLCGWLQTRLLIWLFEV